MGVALWLVARIKGRGSLALDFGCTFARSQWWLVLVGVGTQLAAQLLLAPIAVLDDRRQGVVEDLEDASGVALAVLALSAVLLAPIVEELLFRGLLLRALLRRMSPVPAVAWSAGVFGAVHLVDPAAIVVLPALVGVGVVAGVAAVRTGSVGAAIAVHAGFNLVTVVVLIVS